ncbi:MAG: hypothetical protein AAGC64_04725 [Bacteroidota bacterium]
MKKLTAGFTCLLVVGFSVKAQSIYSFEGLGTLQHQGMPNNVGMGEVGIGTPARWHVNTQNPAYLVYNGLSSFQLGLEVDNRNFSGENVSGNDTEGSLRFLSYAFPVMPGKWSSSFGILPYSVVNYNTFSEGPVDGNENVRQISDNRGEGGLTNFYWANGFKIKNRFLIGLRANYTFGSIERNSRIQIFEEEAVEESDVPLRIPIGDLIDFENQESYSDINFLFGLGYTLQVSEEVFLNFGATYSLESSLNGTLELSLARLNAGREVQLQEVRTLDIDRKLPQSFGLGLSYQRLNVFTIGLDVELQQWKNVERQDDSFNNLTKIAIGADWIPDYDDVNSYFQRARYSIGFNRTRLPYIVNDQGLTDFGVNFGVSLPVGGFSSLDLAFKVGQLGESGNGLIRENYFKLVIGATINDRWFIKRRYD